jgi:hypothetical protein
MKIRPMRTELFHAHGRIDVRTDWRKYRQREINTTKLIVVFRSLTNASTNWTEAFHTGLFSKLGSEARSSVILIFPTFISIDCKVNTANITSTIPNQRSWLQAAMKCVSLEFRDSTVWGEWYSFYRVLAKSSCQEMSWLIQAFLRDKCCTQW